MGGNSLQQEYEYWVEKAKEAQQSGDQAALDEAMSHIEQIQKQAGG